MSAPEQITVVELLVERLKEAGTPRMFGVPGGGSSMDLIDAGRRAGVDFVLSRREDSGSIMAVVTAWLSGAPGLALATKGPGVTSAANGIASAFLDRAPVLFVSDGFGADERDYVSHQYFDQEALLGPVSKGYSTLTSEDPAAEVDRLLQLISQPPHGPAYVELTGAAAKRPIAPGSGRRDDPPTGADGDVEAAKALLAGAKRPVIVAGFESTIGQNAGVVRQLSEALGAPALVTYMAKGVVPDEHPNFAGIFTGGQAEYPCVSEADLIILAGLDPVELIRQPWAYGAPVLDIGAVRHDKHYTEPAAGLYGTIDANIQLLLEETLLSDWKEAEISEYKGAFYDAMAFQVRDAITPVEIVQMAAQAFPNRPRLSVDAGAHMFSAIAFWPAEQPHDVLISNGLASMAFALPAGVAAALHDPERGAVAMTGDGGLMMCLGELVTAAQQNANLTVIVFNDGSLSLIDIKRQSMQLPELGFNWQRPNFAAAAEGFGCRGWRVAKADELSAALSEAAVHRGPGLIDVVLEPDGYLEQMRALRG